MKNHYSSDYVIDYINKNKINGKILLDDVILSLYYAGCGLLARNMSATLPLVFAILKADYEVIKEQRMLEDAFNHNIASPLKLGRILEK